MTFNQRGWSPQCTHLESRQIAVGHLFICDTANDCIQIFYTDGTYMCQVDCNGKLELGTPMRVAWSKTESALVVAHRVNDKCFVSVLNVLIQPN